MKKSSCAVSMLSGTRHRCGSVLRTAAHQYRRSFVPGQYGKRYCPIHISITGFGNVGSTIAEILLHDRFSQHFNYKINIVEPNEQTSQHGKILDFMQATTIHHRHHSFTINNEEAYLAADYIVHTANVVGTKIKEDRMELLEANKLLSKSLFEGKHFTNPNLKIITLSNPLDIITYYAREYANLPAQNVVGTGTYLDDMRMKYYIREQCGVAENMDVNCMVLGEHGPLMVPLFDSAHLTDLRLDGPSRVPLNISGEMRKKLTNMVINAAADIKKTQGYTHFGIATCCISLLHLFMKASMPRSVPADIIESKAVPLCVQITPHYKQLLGIEKDIYLSLPVHILNTSEDMRSDSCYTCPDVARSHYEVIDSSCLSEQEIVSLRYAAKMLESRL
jgi:L-lactate dehydrogenase